MNIDRKIVKKYINKIRVILYSYCEKISSFKGEIELDESYFGGKKLYLKECEFRFNHRHDNLYDYN